MRKIEFKKKKESILNTMFLKLEYMSGDADAWEYQEHQLDGISFSNYTEHLEEIEKIVSQYELISKFTDCNDKLHLGDKRWGLKIEGFKEEYEYIKENYSEELADIYESVPGDTTCDGQRNANLRSIILCGYDNNGDYYESYV